MPRTHQLPRGVAMHEVLKVGPVLRLEEWGEWCKRTMVLTRGAVQFCSAFEGRLVHRHKNAIALCDRAAEADEQDLAAHAERTRPQGEFLLPEVEQDHMLLIHSLSGDHSLVAAADDEDREEWLAWLGALLRAGEAERDIGAMRARAVRHGAELAAAEAAAGAAALGAAGAAALGAAGAAGTAGAAGAAGAAAAAAAAVDAEEMQRSAELDAMERHGHEAEEEKARQHEAGAVQKALARARRDFEVQLARRTAAAAQEAADVGDVAVQRERAARDALEGRLAQEAAAHAAAAAELAQLREEHARYGAGQARAAAEELAAAQAELACAQSELQAHKQQLADAKARAVELEEEVLTTKEEAFNLIQELHANPVLHGKGSQAGSQTGSRPSSAASQQAQRRDSQRR